MRKSILSSLAICALLAAVPAQAADEYAIGLSGAITGPVAGTYAPAVEALRLYIDKVNAAGGVNGHPIRLIVQDDQGQPSMGATNAKKLLGQDNLLLLLNTSLSSTYAPMIAESQRAGVPLLFAASVCPKEVYPPAQPTLFCTTAFASQFDSRATLAFVKEKAGTAVNLGLAAMAIPLSRGEIDYAEGLAGEMGMKAVDKEIVPPAAPDYTPFATKLQQASPDWVYSWAPWVTEVKTLEALRKLGWEGNYIGWGHIETEGELARLKDGKFYAIGANALFSDKLPVQQEVTATAMAANSTYAANLMTEGWIAGMVVEAALKQAGWPATPEKVLAAMSHLKVDTKGLRGGPLEWTADNHFRTRQYYRVYRWNPASNGIEVVKDWTAYEVH